MYENGAAELLQEIDKAALVCPAAYRRPRANRARRRHAPRTAILLFGASRVPRSPSLCLAALQSMRTSLARSTVWPL